jgi:hypothetical protein
MNLLIIGYCKLDDGFLYASRALEKLNYTIFFFPYFNYILDAIPNKDDILNSTIIKQSSKKTLIKRKKISNNHLNSTVKMEKKPNSIK